MFYDADIPALNLASGRVHTVNGQTYDLAVPDDRQRMMDENLVYWIDEMRAAIREIDPTALVTISFPAVVGGPRLVRPQVAIEDSTAAFVDLHMYLGLGTSLDYYLRSFGYDGDTERPVILGEYGAHRRGFPSAEAAAEALRDLQAATCALGFDGWLLWTFDADKQTGLYNGLSEGGVIDRALAPVNRPDPCR
jgi:endo-1,4-beta-mannosidase